MRAEIEKLLAEYEAAVASSTSAEDRVWLSSRLVKAIAKAMDVTIIEWETENFGVDGGYITAVLGVTEIMKINFN